jgi:hypothetical protein
MFRKTGGSYGNVPQNGGGYFPLSVIFSLFFGLIFPLFRMFRLFQKHDWTIATKTDFRDLLMSLMFLYKLLIIIIIILYYI